jgi:hypothetical protein
VATNLVLEASSDSRITPDLVGANTLKSPPLPEIVAMSANVIIHFLRSAQSYRIEDKLDGGISINLFARYVGSAFSNDAVTFSEWRRQ